MFRSASARPAQLVISASIAAAALLLTGCSGGDSGSADKPEGPLSQYLTALYDGEEYSQEKFDQEQLKLEELVAECMTQEGFEYVPNTSTGDMMVSEEDDEDSGPEWGSEEFIKEYGYGIIAWPGQSDIEDVDDTQDIEEYVDPNEGYVQSLSESEQNAYYEALNGPGPTDEEMEAMADEDYSYEYNWETAGCYGSAQHNSSSDNSAVDAYEDPEFTELFESMDSVWTSVYDEEALNEDIVKLNLSWADCMAEAGYTEFNSPNSAQNVLYEEYDALYQSDDETGEYQEPSKAASEEFKEREITVALADFNCKDSVSYDDEVQRVQNDLEQKFVDEHKAELDAMLAKYEPEAAKN